MTESTTKRLPVALLTLRLGVFIVMIMWSLDKFVQPEHTAGVFANFYGLGGLDPFNNPNLLFFAAWPMLAACFTLYYLRDQDTLMTRDQLRK